MVSISVTLAKLKPIRHRRVMDLVREAGLDVSASAKGEGRPSPYEWAFVQSGGPIVLCLWFDEMQEVNGQVFQKLNFRNEVKSQSGSQLSPNKKGKASRMDQAIRAAYENQLPIRVIICDARNRRLGARKPKHSSVDCRALDEATWAVTAYDWLNGDSTIVRGVKLPMREKSWIDGEMEGHEGALKAQYSNHRQREYRLREYKLREALAKNGDRLMCEVPNCSFDFVEKYGELGRGFMHVHHKSPLRDAPAEGKKIRLEDLALVCPNCHAMIHRQGECRPLESLVPEKV